MLHPIHPQNTVTESFRLGKTSKSIMPSLWSLPCQPEYRAPCAVIHWKPPGMVTPTPSWKAHSSAWHDKLLCPWQNNSCLRHRITPSAQRYWVNTNVNGDYWSYTIKAILSILIVYSNLMASVISIQSDLTLLPCRALFCLTTDCFIFLQMC